MLGATSVGALFGVRLVGWLLLLSLLTVTREHSPIHWPTVHHIISLKNSSVQKTLYCFVHFYVDVFLFFFCFFTILNLLSFLVPFYL